MKRRFTLLFAILMMTATSFAQGSKNEAEIRKIHDALTQGFLKRDLTAFERNAAEEYWYAGPSGKLMSRAESIAEIKKELASPTEKIIALTNDAVKLRIVGNMAIVSAGESVTTSGLAAGSEPHTDTGRYTGITRNARVNGG
ncbi:MAG: nuclear transport factor 2 family protein [Pyrinomonadaceae bacterium]